MFNFFKGYKKGDIIIRLVCIIGLTLVIGPTLLKLINIIFISKDVNILDISDAISVIFFLVVIGGIYKICELTQKTEKIIERNFKEGEGISFEENKKIEPPKTYITFKDVAGLAEEKFELEEVVDFLKNPQKYKEMGAKIPRGILLSGSPGTGKTLLAKALAGEAGVSFLSSSGAEFVEKYVGVGASRVRELFEKARKEAPCIIFIDEIDAIGGERDDSSNTVEHNQTLEQLLIEMDGFQQSAEEDGIIVVGATNRIESMDKALLRPGRFDRQIAISLPNVHDREEILKLHARNKKFDDNVNLKKLAYNTSGCSGAQLKNILNESAIIAVRNGHTKISDSDIDVAMKKVMIGLSKSKSILNEKEKTLVSYHEAGHAVVSMFLQTHDKVKEISIIGAGSAGGYTWYESSEDKNFVSKTKLEEQVISLLGGRAAEKLFVHDISTGASNDLERATDIITKMLIVYGMDEVIGPISMMGKYTEYIESDSYSNEILNRIKVLLREAENKATEILKEHSSFVEDVVKLLIEKETIKSEELYQMFSAYKNALAENKDA